MSQKGLRPSLSNADWADHCEFISGAAYSLLAHYFDPRHADDVIAVTSADWVDVLEPFSRDTIIEARLRWIADQRIRPTPADIKSLCFKVIAGH